jgi:hypothetical protein
MEKVSESPPLTPHVFSRGEPGAGISPAWKLFISGGWAQALSVRLVWTVSRAARLTLSLTFHSLFGFLAGALLETLERNRIHLCLWLLSQSFWKAL